jgi:predicted nucleotidyltransferase
VRAELLDAVVADFDPIQVILFGRQVRGEAGAECDIDLLVVLDDKAPAGARPSKRARTSTTRSTSCPAAGAGSSTSAP